MSDVDPFASQGDNLPVPAEVASDLEVFKAPLDGFDFAAYEQRQEQLDQALRTGDPQILAELLHQLQAQDTEVGIKLNNIHNTTLEGTFPGFVAPLAVMTKTVVKAAMPGLNFYAGVATRANFSGRNLRGSNFSDSILSEADFTDVDLRGSEFNNVVLTNVDFTGARVEGVDFSNAYMVGVRGLEDPEIVKRVNLSGVRTTVVADEDRQEGSLDKYLASRFGDPSDMDTIKRMLDPVPIAIDQVLPRLVTKKQLRGLVGVNLIANNVDFSDSHLIGAILENFTANGVQFRNVAMSGTIIKEGLMRGADLFSAWAPGLILEDVDLRDSRLHNSNLVGSVLRGVDLRGVVGLDAKDTNVEGIVLEDCKLPQGYGYDGVAIQLTDKKRRELEE